MRIGRAYFLASSQDPENLARAEASLQELIDSANGPLDDVSRAYVTAVILALPLFQTSAEYQQLRWMRVAILKRRKAAHAPLLEGQLALRVTDPDRGQSFGCRSVPCHHQSYGILGE